MFIHLYFLLYLNAFYVAAILQIETTGCPGDKKNKALFVFMVKKQHVWPSVEVVACINTNTPHTDAPHTPH